ncbi:hypothetical protein L873DRAFT_1840196 [Choiromyces venosus 120613-1]|uniref:Uncharacterized protein n=1 Tax=Choiromyces venosus 120613-1 TaxID=1336337 RepID=A0A3N4K4I2_9PEZI|nr:hypothetical protein L873DRAFT_1840196 [Choiromyces venosus 120613-1]
MQQQGQQMQQIQEQIQQGYENFLEEAPRGNKNSFARVVNSRVSNGGMVLETLYGVNGQLVPNFPRTRTGPAIDQLLLDLGLDTTGTMARRKLRFNKYIGIVTNAHL